MSGFRQNPEFHGDLGRQVQGAMRELELALDVVARSHAGRPEPEVEAELERVIACHGVQPDVGGVKEMARAISSQDPID